MCLIAAFVGFPYDAKAVPDGRSIHERRPLRAVVDTRIRCLPPGARRSNYFNTAVHRHTCTALKGFPSELAGTSNPVKVLQNPFDTVSQPGKSKDARSEEESAYRCL